MRKLLIGSAAVALVVSLSACGGTATNSTFERGLQRQVDRYAISQIEKTSTRRSSKKDIDQMVGLFAPNATGTFGRGKTAAGKAQIRKSG